MANATAKVTKGILPRGTFAHWKRSSETLAAEKTYYTTALIGIDETGYFCKGDDTQAWILGGVVRGEEGNPVLPAGTAGDGTIDLSVSRPDAIELAISGVAVTDIGKTVYALYDQTGTLDYSATTYANVVGTVVDYISSGIALVELAYDGTAANKRLGAAKRLAATGAQTISKYDAGKTLFCANTATLTLTLPPIADVPAGRDITIVKDHASDTNAITLDGNSAETIEGSATVNSQDAPYDVVRLVSNGTLWVYGSRDVA